MILNNLDWCKMFLVEMDGGCDIALMASTASIFSSNLIKLLLSFPVSSDKRF
jgi:hypothetical protein